MGTKFKFCCDKCDYQAEVSGKKDYGMVAVVRTMHCKGCNHIVDVLVGQYGEEGKTGFPEFDCDLNICPECGGDDVVVWQESKPCPKCSGKMTEDRSIIFNWD